MKITEVVLKDFHQFKDLTIDVTYPKGHDKEGEPLDKVCIIGQSGTGKTTLLKVIGGHTFTSQSLLSEFEIDVLDGVQVSRRMDDLHTKVQLGINPEINLPGHRWNVYYLEGKEVDFKIGLDAFYSHLEKVKTHFIFFPADLKYDSLDASSNNLIDKKVVDFRTDKVSDIWKIVFSEVKKYQEEEIKLKQDIAEIAVGENADLEKIQIAVKKLEKWKRKAKSPIVKLADECLDQVLNQLNLKVSTKDFSFDSKEDIGVIKIEDMHGNVVPYSLLSTGTKQIMLTAIPLYFLKPDQTLILCDEPERSLYPSLQKFIIDYYISLTKNSQFFFATHSPIIASCFEPWEIVELKFDDQGYVYQEQYYTGERHVDNYTIIPSYLTYDLILSKVFDVEETHSYERSEKITEVLMLRNQLQQLKKQGDIKSAAAKEIYQSYTDLAAKLFWDFDIE